ncbi:unnamed protein product [Choristocarpus tenellus]
MPPNGYRRRASHAGSWYTDNGALLYSQLAGWLDVAGSIEDQEPVRALIAPHAGFRRVHYSGSTAAFAYTHMNPVGISRVFVIGPSHHVSLR